MKDLIENIKLDKSLASSVSSIDSNLVNKITEQCKTSFSALSRYDDITRLAVCLNFAEKYTKQMYLDRGISLDVYYATTSDIAIWCENNDNRGLKNYNWIKNHLNFELFRIGRLQFQIFKCNIKNLRYSKLPFSYGDNLIYIHIPQGEKLVYSDCVESIRQSLEFFDKYFPEYDYGFYFCDSWLLYQGNYEFMSPGCNILQFQSLFDIGYSISNDNQAIERIFGKRRLVKSRYPENTSLQRQAKHYIMNKGKLGMGIGFIYKFDI